MAKANSSVLKRKISDGTVVSAAEGTDVPAAEVVEAAAVGTSAEGVTFSGGWGCV